MNAHFVAVYIGNIEANAKNMGYHDCFYITETNMTHVKLYVSDIQDAERISNNLGRVHYLYAELQWA